MEVVYGASLTLVSIAAGVSLHSNDPEFRGLGIMYGFGLILSKSYTVADKKNIYETYIDVALTSFSLGAIFGAAHKK